jgi:hypothetical protein
MSVMLFLFLEVIKEIVQTFIVDITDDNRSSSPMSSREVHGHLIPRREGYLTPNHFARSASLGVAGRTPINPMSSNPSSSTGKEIMGDSSEVVLLKGCFICNIFYNI